MKLFGVRFHPAGLYPLLRSSLSELTDKVENIEAVLGIRGKELEEKIFESGSDAERIAVFENMMNKIFEGPQIRGLTSVGLDMIIKNQGQIKVEDVARSLETNTKTLERHFNREIGINPKMFCRVERLQNVLQSIKKVPGMRWTEIAYSFGYVDQAHFIRDFRGFAGVSPSAFVKQQNTISDSFVG
ncbi:MAG: AraC family transcriptional regulator [Acidobacteria bacterium]|nr:AraC family transcriptional regulator [Acidobacteriota bacterium]